MYCRILRIAIPICLVVFGTATADAAQPIRIGMSLAPAGRYAPMGGMYAKGLRLWEKDINNKGGHSRSAG